MSLFSRISPPGLINTTAAQSSFLSPTSTTANPPLGSALGGAATTAAAAPAAASLFGASTNQPPGSAPATGTTFGQTPAVAPTLGSTPAAGGSMFGAAVPSNTASTAGGGLFGASTPASTAPAGVLFGQSAAPAAGGMFGASTTTPAAQTTGGLFGNTAQQPQQQQQSGFGGGLFGAQQQQPQQQAGGLFGQQQPQPQAGFGGSLLGGQQHQQGGMFGRGFGTSLQQQSQQQQQPMQQQAVDMNFSNMRGITRYEELNDLVKKQLDQLDEHIAGQMKISADLGARAMGQREAMESVEADVDLVSRKYATTNSVLNTDGSSIGHLNNNSQQLLQTATTSTRTIDILRVHPSQRAYLPAHHIGSAENTLIPYFQGLATDMERRTENYLHAMGEVERTLEGMEREVATSSGGGGETRVKEVVKAERMVFSGMVAVAGRVAGLNEDLKDLVRDRR